jgi:hypothetical protein
MPFYMYIFTVLKYSKNMTYKIYLLLAILLISITATQAQTNVGVNTNTPDASAALDVSSTTQGMLVPRMSASQRGLISSPATGLLVYQTDAPAGFYFYDGTAWTSLSGGGSSLPTQTGNAGKVLSTDGTTASWTIPSGVKTELIASKTTGTQRLPNANGTNTGSIVTFDNIITAPTIGTFSANTYTVGTGGAGLYLIQTRLANVDSTASPNNTMGVFSWVSVNGSAISSANSAMGNYSSNPTFNMPNNTKGNAQLNMQLVYLNAGDNVKIYGLAANASIPPTAMKTDGYCKLYIVKLN